MKRFALSKPAERDLDQIKAYLVVEAGPAVLPCTGVLLRLG